MTTTLNAAMRVDIAGSQADPLRPAASDPLHEDIESLGSPRAPAGHLGSVLARYWLELPRRSLEDRRWMLESFVQRVKSGELGVRALVAFALGDPECAIVHEATVAYVAGTPVSVERRAILLDETLDWIRRGLAVNRCAVFEALLGLDDPSTHARLAALRLTLTAEETAAVHARAAGSASRATREFIDDWRRLLDDSQ